MIFICQNSTCQKPTSQLDLLRQGLISAKIMQIRLTAKDRPYFLKE
ncbi:hypothetical protein HMPREF0645_1362 [Hallella bergensis DSM 17361]|uniref:Uncharacterized protein n=1 Tax=Hallella bergensis DSM 17361 TaxID=585502 RepID=D1PWM7_9BACT|nr:hypothetical protein HMPREF0645_1362 [Hallella bergensis DSM 17361]